jgi:hypothetical protein
MRNVRRLSPVSVSVCRPFRRAQRFSIGAINAQHRLHGVVRSISTAYPQGPILGMRARPDGLAAQPSTQAEKTRRVDAAGLSLDRSCEFWTVRDRQEAIPGPLRNPSSPQPPCMSGDPLPVALPDRSAPALHLYPSVESRAAISAALSFVSASIAPGVETQTSAIQRQLDCPKVAPFGAPTCVPLMIRRRAGI